eukprot:COSAG01_NODE_14843_length_1403_cov_9.275307_1_plen_247_part_00
MWVGSTPLNRSTPLETTSKKSFYRELRNQEDLLKIPKVKPKRAPTELVRKSKEYDDSFPFDDLPAADQWSKGDRISIRWRRVRKLNSSADDLVYDNPQLLQTWLQEDRLLAVRDDTIWADGTINLVRNVGVNYTLRIRFDDGVQGTVNLTNESSLNYVPPASVRRVMSGSGAEIPLYQPFKSTAKNKKYGTGCLCVVQWSWLPGGAAAACCWWPAAAAGGRPTRRCGGGQHRQPWGMADEQGGVLS